jgi:acetyl esterase/lipase
VDPELAAALPYLPQLPFSQLAETRATFAALLDQLPPPDTSGVVLEERPVPGPEGAPDVPVRVFRPESGGSGRPGVLDVHGGGFAIGSAALDDAVNVGIVREVGAVVVSVEYRLAPETPYPGPAEDCYAALRWLAGSAAELGVDPGRLAVLGDSAGGGLAATTALLARDRGGPALAMQALIEPELDDRLQTHSMVHGDDTPVWHRPNAIKSWEFYLGGREADGYAAPARMADLSGLPPTYLTVNQLDPLRDEGLEYAQRLLQAGVATELHCWPGAFHGFVLVPTAAITQRAVAALYGALARGLGVESPVAVGNGVAAPGAAAAEAATGV